MWDPKQLLERAEHYIYLAAGYILVVAAAGLLITAVIDLIHGATEGNYADAVIHLLDRVLLALMLAEIIYTVGRIAHTLKIEVEPFLIVGIIAAVRRMLIITAESAGHVDLADTTFQAAIAELGLLAVIIIFLSAAIWLIKRPPENP